MQGQTAVRKQVAVRQIMKNRVEIWNVCAKLGNNRGKTKGILFESKTYLNGLNWWWLLINDFKNREFFCAKLRIPWQQAVVRTHDLAKQIIKIGGSRLYQVILEFFNTKSLSCCKYKVCGHNFDSQGLTTRAAATHHVRRILFPVQAIKSRHCSLKLNLQLSSLWGKKLAARPCRAYYGEIFVVNGKQSVVQNLISWFSTCKNARATQADVNLK